MRGKAKPLFMTPYTVLPFTIRHLLELEEEFQTVEGTKIEIVEIDTMAFGLQRIFSYFS